MFFFKAERINQLSNKDYSKSFLIPYVTTEFPVHLMALGVWLVLVSDDGPKHSHSTQSRSDIACVHLFSPHTAYISKDRQTLVNL